MEKRFARLDSEEPFESKDGYARKNTEVYASVFNGGGGGGTSGSSGGDGWTPPAK